MNPFTQLIGLTLLVHMCVILLKKTGIPFRSFLPKRVLHRVPKVFSLSIILCVVLFVAVFVSTVIEKSFTDEYSNVRLAGDAYRALQVRWRARAQTQVGVAEFSTLLPPLAFGGSDKLPFTLIPKRLPVVGLDLEVFGSLCFVGYCGLVHARARRRAEIACRKDA